MAIVNRQDNPTYPSLKLFHSVVTADETVPAAAHFTLSAPILFGSTISHEFVDVSAYDRIRVYFAGTTTTNQTVTTINFYGMYRCGGLKQMALSTTALLSATGSLPRSDANGPGFLQSVAGVEPEVTRVFETENPGTTWLLVDDWGTITLDETPTGPVDYMQFVNGATDRPGHIDIDLSYTRYDYILSSIAIGTAVSLGAVFFPLRLRDLRKSSDRI